MDHHFVLSVFHIVFVVPLLLFVGFHRADTPSWLYMTLLALGGIVFLYHGFRGVYRFLSNSHYTWVNMIHALLVGPLLLYIGWHQKDTPRQAYEMLLLLAFGALGYHMFSLVRLLRTFESPKGVTA
jgi:lipoprotein signal peptidase